MKITSNSHKKLDALIYMAWLLSALTSTLATYSASARPVAAKSQANSAEASLRLLVQDIVSCGIPFQFKNGRIANEKLIQFGIACLALREPARFRPGTGEGSLRLHAQDVAAIASRYFGQAVRHQSVGDWHYRQGYYYGYSEMIEQISPEKIVALEIGTPTGTSVPVLVRYRDSMASQDVDHDVIRTIKTIWKKVRGNGQQRYILIGYNPVERSVKQRYIHSAGQNKKSQ